MSDRVTVIIPVYNASKTIGKCLDSLLNQDYLNYKILVVNDGSTDDTLKVLKSYRSFNKIKIFSQKNKGVSSARNLGINNLNSGYVTFVDSDDYVEKNYISDLVKGYSKEDIDLSIIGVRHHTKEGKELLTKYSEGVFPSKVVLDNIFNNNSPQGYLCNKLWKVSIINEFNLRLNEKIKMAEDLLFTVQYLLHSRKVSICNCHDYNYIHRNDSLSSGIYLKDNNLNFRDVNNDFIEVSKKIVNLIPENDKQGKINSEAFLGINCMIYIRQIEKMKNISFYKDDKKLIRNLVLLGLKCKKSIERTTIISKKRKLAYFITMYFPNIIGIIDRKRFKK